MKKKIKQKISGNNNIQVAGNYVKTKKNVQRTEAKYNQDVYITDVKVIETRDSVTEIYETF